MKTKPILAILSMVLIVALAVAGCTTTKTVTQTVANTTLTQWTSAVTETKTVTSPPTILTLPAVTNTVFPPAETTTVTAPPQTITSPPVTSYVTETNTITLPPVTTTATITVTPTPPPVVNASDAIDMSVTFLGSMGASQDVTTGQPLYYIALSYKNNANQAFTNVKYSFSLLLSGITFNAANPTNDELNCYTVPQSALTVWTRVASTINVWTFSNFQGFNVGANESGTLLLALTLDSNSNGAMALALSKVL